MQKYVKCTCFYVTTCFFIESPALGFFSSLHFYNNWVCLDLCRFCLSAIENKNPSIQFVTITFTSIQWPNVRYFLRVFSVFFFGFNKCLPQNTFYNESDIYIGQQQLQQMFSREGGQRGRMVLATQTDSPNDRWIECSSFLSEFLCE